MIVLRGAREASCRRVFNYSPYLCSFPSFLVGVLPMWALWDCCLPAHLLSSSQGREPPWEYTSDASVIKGAGSSLHRSHGVFTDVLPLQVKKLPSHVGPMFPTRNEAKDISGGEPCSTLHTSEMLRLICVSCV